MIDRLTTPHPITRLMEVHSVIIRKLTPNSASKRSNETGCRQEAWAFSGFISVPKVSLHPSKAP